MPEGNPGNYASAHDGYSLTPVADWWYYYQPFLSERQRELSCPWRVQR